ncbi:CcmD family protein [bacterium]|nr:CcmD family protein [bacterium]
MAALITAYALIWGALLLYMLSIFIRQNGLLKEIDNVKRLIEEKEV